MLRDAIPPLLLIATLASALVAGIFYAFSSFVMGALGRVPPRTGIDAMRSINLVVINPSFLILFMGTSLLCVVLAIWSLFSLGESGTLLILVASLLYIIGCFGVTMVFNVPLNNRLAAASPVEVEAVWATYLRDWTKWNTVRTIAPTFSAVLFVLALVQRN